MTAITDATIIAPAKASKGYWASVGSRLIKDKVAMVALTIILLIVLLGEQLLAMRLSFHPKVVAAASA